MEYCIFDTAWGSFGFVARGAKLVATFLPAPGREIRRAIEMAYPDAQEHLRAMPEFRRQVTDYFDGKPVRFTAKVDLSSRTPFHCAALEACKRIAYGKTSSYGELARKLGKPAASRAVGGAMARNPLPLVIPCHRVLRSGGALGGFSSAGGCGEKERMLELETQGLAVR